MASAARLKQFRRHSRDDSGEADVRIILAGNPNVGKSTLFNALTGLHQHTGNWPGKTVETASGHFTYQGRTFRIVDLPGTYSLSPRSPEEEITGDKICFGEHDLVLLAADASRLERNLPFILQVLETTDRAVLCVNMMDEAERRGVQVDIHRLSKFLGIPAVGVSADRKKTLTPLLSTLRQESTVSSPQEYVLYPAAVGEALSGVAAVLEEKLPVDHRKAMWISCAMLGSSAGWKEKIDRWCAEHLEEDARVREALREAEEQLHRAGITSPETLESACILHRLALAGQISELTVTRSRQTRDRLDRRLDSIVSGRLLGFPLMLLGLAGIFYLTLRGANAPTRLLSEGLSRLGELLSAVLLALGCPQVIHDALIMGSYRMLSWVVSVMLPPMLIFFPLFTALEDIGYLPRAAFNLDCPFQCCGGCGKQALTMAMGLGCNAVGVTGCRIIDSPRERLIAVLTNSFVPCNGRFPMLIVLITAFFSSDPIRGAGILTAFLCLSVLATLAASRLLSATVLKGKSSSFVLELPPYRKIRLGQILIRSVLDRTVFVLGRAAAVAAPAGLLIWALAHIPAGEGTLIRAIADWLEPAGHFLGMDGVMLLAFILGLPANETVLPIALMLYSGGSTLGTSAAVGDVSALLLSHGWTLPTAMCAVIFSLLHWPCSTTLLTIRKETGSLRWTLLAAVLPTVCGVLLCALCRRVFVDY